MHQIVDLIKNHGDLFYLITFVWTALEGESFVILAGLLAQRGLVNVWLLFVAAWLGSMCGDQVVFFLGRVFGLKLLEHFPKLKPKIDLALGWLEKYAVIFILSYRFMYGVRNVSSIAIGLSTVPWKKFGLWNAVASFLWAAAFVGFGYSFGDAIGSRHHKEMLVEDSVRQLTLGGLGLFALIILVKLCLIQWKRMREQKRAQATLSNCSDANRE